MEVVSSTYDGERQRVLLELTKFTKVGSGVDFSVIIHDVYDTRNTFNSISQAKKESKKVNFKYAL